jgi:hypothetical protein
VSAEHDDNAAFLPMCVDHCSDNALEVARYENFRKPGEERAKASVVLWRRCELLRANLVRPALDGNRADLRKVRLLAYLRLVGGVYDFR